MQGRRTPIVSVVSGWAVSWNRELAQATGSQLRTHLRAVHRKISLRSQQLSFTRAGNGLYNTPQARLRRVPS